MTGYTTRPTKSVRARALFDRTSAWMSTAAVAGRLALCAANFGDVLRALERDGFLESRRDQDGGSSGKEWRRRQPAQVEVTK